MGWLSRVAARPLQVSEAEERAAPVVEEAAAEPAAEPARHPVADFTLKAPVDVHALAVALGLTLVEAPLPKGLAGRVARGEGHYVLAVNARHDRLQRRFDIAHGLARFVLHRHLFGNELTYDELYRSGLGEAVDSEANTFASMILMPPNLVRETGNVGLAAEIEATFDVSTAVAEIRLRGVRRN